MGGWTSIVCGEGVGGLVVEARHHGWMFKSKSKEVACEETYPQSLSRIWLVFPITQRPSPSFPPT